MGGIRNSPSLPNDFSSATFGASPTGAYLSIDSSGNVTLNNDATVWDDLRVAGSAVRVGASSPPDFETFKGGISIYWFSPIALEEIHFMAQLPHSYKHGTGLRPHIHWVPRTVNTGNVDWFLEYTWANIGDEFPPPLTVIASGSASGTIGYHQLSAFPEISGSSQHLSSMLVCRLYRDGGQGDDTFTGDAGFLEFDFHYQIDSLGSSLEYLK